MDLLIYNELDTQQIAGFDKLCLFLQQDDFKSADVKKIQPNLYRAKLNRSDRILFSIYDYQDKKYILLLEYLKKHDYQGSRFLNGEAIFQEDQIKVIESVNDLETNDQLVYLNSNNPKFVYLNKFISFDDVQEHIYRQPPPLMIIGSAGSGKTAILLEKMKKLTGHVLYVTLSSFLVKNSRELYFSGDYYNSEQQVDFYAFDEFIESIEVPNTQQADFDVFLKWYKANENYKKYSPHSVYEEFKGVLTGAFTHAAYLTEEVYQALGIKQSIFSQHEKSEVYAIFIRYLNYLKDEKYYETNVLSFEYLEKVPQHYDYVIIDEVQDITAIQLYLILNSLKQSGLFLLCGDANQIVHPNFFSWAKVKSLFHQHQHLHDGLEITHILHHNYRNSKRVTEISNRVLLLKNARFGSIDKESHYLVESNADLQGGVYFLKNHPDILSELDQKTAISTQFAVIVMHEEQKRQAQRVFKTPLVFSIQEAKGLEYTNIILYNFVSNATTHFNDICQDIQIEDLQRDFKYARHKDKQDKSLEIYKFYINALYVGLTRAMQHLYWVEKEHDHRLFRLLGLQKAAEKLDLDEQQSSLKDWQKEAQRLELQGKKEQAQRIRSEILKEEQPDWQVMTGSMLKKIEHDALIEGHKKSKLQLFEYAVVYLHQRYLAELADSGFKPAQQIFDESLNLRDEKSKQTVLGKYYTDYQVKHPTALKKKIEKFGLNYKNEFDQTPLTAATWVGNTMLFRLLLDEGADQHCLDAFKRNLFQVALLNAVRSEKYASGFFHENEHLLPRDSIILQLEHKLFKLESQQAEYVIFNLMYLMQFIRGVQHFIAFDRHTCSGLLMQYVEYLPEKIWSTSRKKRSYLSGLLSRNEVESRDPYNKKIFKRIKRGEYILNPDLVMKVEGQWQPIYSVMGIDRMGEYPSVRNTISSTQQLESHQMLVEKRKQAIDTLARLFQ